MQSLSALREAVPVHRRPPCCCAWLAPAAGSVVQVAIPEGHIGYQVGEALQVGAAGGPAMPTAADFGSQHALTTDPRLPSCRRPQVHSGGLLRGTPHAVFAPRPHLSGGVSRNTFAVFMQPRCAEKSCFCWWSLLGLLAAWHPNAQ